MTGVAMTQSGSPEDASPAMSVGVFIPIGNNGWLLSQNAPQYRPSFELNKRVTLKAEAYGFDFALSMIKLRGFGGGDRVLGPQPRLA